MLSIYHILYLVLTLTITRALAAINGPCSVGSTPGVCIATAQCSSASGSSSVGFCPNDPADIKCCTKPSCGVGGHCGWTAACTGTTKTGLCPGPADFKCCFPASTGSGAHSLSSNGVKFIAGFEGFRKDFYIDAAAVKTIGYGHACQPSSACNSISPPITQAEGLSLLNSDAARFVSCVDSAVTVPLTQNQFDALVSFAFNLGCGPIPKIANFINNSRYKAATDDMLLYVYGGGVVLPGLVRRRQAEVALFYTV